MHESKKLSDSRNNRFAREVRHRQRFGITATNSFDSSIGLHAKQFVASFCTKTRTDPVASEYFPGAVSTAHLILNRYNLVTPYVSQTQCTTRIAYGILLNSSSLVSSAMFILYFRQSLLIKIVQNHTITNYSILNISCQYLKFYAI